MFGCFGLLAGWVLCGVGEFVLAVCVITWLLMVWLSLCSCLDVCWWCFGWCFGDLVSVVLLDLVIRWLFNL